ncbi:uncharacterized protein TNCV_2117471 [Trichonephila clavipes]|nr:uncharacterized protein TNCV_2117471 [Trichonephila clavipes]
MSGNYICRLKLFQLGTNDTESTVKWYPTPEVESLDLDPVSSFLNPSLVGEKAWDAISSEKLIQIETNSEIGRFLHVIVTFKFTIRVGCAMLLKDVSSTRVQLGEQKTRSKKRLPVRLINTTNERRLFQRQETPLRVKGDIEDVYRELDNGGQRFYFLDETPRILLFSAN